MGFGVTLHEKLNEPILIIKAAWGGKSLHTQFRPPIGEEWVPPKDHPDHPDNQPAPLPIPKSIELPADFKAPQTTRGKNIQVMGGVPIGEINGIHPIYVTNLKTKTKRGELKFKNLPFQVGDLVIGINGEGLGPDPVKQWRNTWFETARAGDWKVKITWWRAGKIDTVEIDTAIQLGNGRAGIPDYLAQVKANRKKIVDNGGEYYAKMMNYIQTILADPGKHHPAYDPKQGYEIAGFVWFQGYNDQINGSVYPNREKPRGFEQYSWLLAHLIRHVRKELKTPQMPFVIGVFGQGGVSDKPIPFREGMAAPASYEEFKGTVAAVRTAPFWDSRIDEIKSKVSRVLAHKGDDPNHPFAKLQAEVEAYKEKMGDPEKLERKARGKLTREIKDGIVKIIQTPEEIEYLRNNVSNQGYHYHGSPKFFARAGEAFAEALAKMIK